MEVKCNLFPGGVRRALTMSYDDGAEFDRRLVGIFNENGIRGTFHLNSGKLGTEGYVSREETAMMSAFSAMAVSMNLLVGTSVPRSTTS